MHNVIQQIQNADQANHDFKPIQIHSYLVDIAQEKMQTVLVVIFYDTKNDIHNLIQKLCYHLQDA